MQIPARHILPTMIDCAILETKCPNVLLPEFGYGTLCFVTRKERLHPVQGFWLLSGSAAPFKDSRPDMLAFMFSTLSIH